MHTVSHAGSALVAALWVAVPFASGTGEEPSRSDGVPTDGCDGNLAGGSGNTGGVCILFAMTHGGVPNEPYEFSRAAARWITC